MAKNCYLIWQDGYLTCTVQHTKAKCDLDRDDETEGE